MRALRMKSDNAFPHYTKLTTAEATPMRSRICERLSITLFLTGGKATGIMPGCDIFIHRKTTPKDKKYHILRCTMVVMTSTLTEAV